jgi:hypothetical protein
LQTGHVRRLVPPPKLHHDLIDAAAKVGALEVRLGYVFKNRATCIEALKVTGDAYPIYHDGVVYDYTRNNRLALLGDRVLSLVVCEMWFETDHSTKEHSDMSSETVSRNALAVNACDIGLHKSMLTQDTSNSMHTNKDNLAETFEAVLGAVYVDSNYDVQTVKALCRRLRLDEHRFLKTREEAIDEGEDQATNEENPRQITSSERLLEDAAVKLDGATQHFHSQASDKSTGVHSVHVEDVIEDVYPSKSGIQPQSHNIEKSIEGKELKMEIQVEKITSMTKDRRKSRSIAATRTLRTYKELREQGKDVSPFFIMTSIRNAIVKAHNLALQGAEDEVKQAIKAAKHPMPGKNLQMQALLKLAIRRKQKLILSLEEAEIQKIAHEQARRIVDRATSKFSGTRRIGVGEAENEALQQEADEQAQSLYSAHGLAPTAKEVVQETDADKVEKGNKASKGFFSGLLQIGISEAHDKTSREVEDKISREVEHKASRDAEDKARQKSEDKARRIAEDRARQTAVNKVRKEAEERPRQKVEEKASKGFSRTRRIQIGEAEDKESREAEDELRREAEEKSGKEAEEKSGKEAEEKSGKEAEEKSGKEAEENSGKEVGENARKEAGENARKEAGENARKEVVTKAQKEAEEKARERKEVKDKMRKEAEAEAKARKEAKDKIQKEAEAEVEAKARKEAEEKAHQGMEAEVKANARMEAESKAIHRAKAYGEALKQIGGSRKKAELEGEARKIEIEQKRALGLLVAREDSTAQAPAVEPASQKEERPREPVHANLPASKQSVEELESDISESHLETWASASAFDTASSQMLTVRHVPREQRSEDAPNNDTQLAAIATSNIVDISDSSIRGQDVLKPSNEIARPQVSVDRVSAAQKQRKTRRAGLSLEKLKRDSDGWRKYIDHIKRIVRIRIMNQEVWGTDYTAASKKVAGCMHRCTIYRDDSRVCETAVADISSEISRRKARGGLLQGSRSVGPSTQAPEEQRFGLSSEGTYIFKQEHPAHAEKSGIPETSASVDQQMRLSEDTWTTPTPSPAEQAHEQGKEPTSLQPEAPHPTIETLEDTLLQERVVQDKQHISLLPVLPTLDQVSVSKDNGVDPWSLPRPPHLGPQPESIVGIHLGSVSPSDAGVIRRVRARRTVF